MRERAERLAVGRHAHDIRLKARRDGHRSVDRPIGGRNLNVRLFAIVGAHAHQDGGRRRGRPIDGDAGFVGAVESGLGIDGGSAGVVE